MTTFVRWLCLLLLAFWVGGILFFGGVEAPVLFRHIPQQEAGVVVASSLHQLHRAGMVIGVSLALFLLLFPRALATRTRIISIALAIVMFGVTVGLNAMIQTRMEPIRLAAPNQDISTLPQSDPGRASFDAMHAWSTRLEGIVLLAGIGLFGCFAIKRDI